MKVNLVGTVLSLFVIVLLWRMVPASLTEAPEPPPQYAPVQYAPAVKHGGDLIANPLPSSAPMTTVNIGPCACCGGTPGPCCDLSKCMDLIVTIGHASFPGTFTAVWNTDAGEIASYGYHWKFTTGGCTWRVLSTDSAGSAVLGVSSDGSSGATNEAGGTCSRVGCISTLTLAVESPGVSEFCGEVFTDPFIIKWNCCYPEYLELSGFDTGIWCNDFNNGHVPIDCTLSSPMTTLVYYFNGSMSGRAIEFKITYNVCAQTVQLEAPGMSGEYHASGVKLSDFISSPTTVTNSTGDPICTASSITLTPMNNDIWCP